MGRPKSNRRQPTGAQIGYEGAIGHEVTGIDPSLGEESAAEPGSLELDGLYVDDIPRESRAAQPAPGPKRKRKKKRASERRLEREPDIHAPPDGPETTHALPQPESELGLSGTGPSGKLSYAAGVLQCTKGPEEGLALNLIEGSYTIGRARENNFVLKDIAASREHLRIVVENNMVKAVDLGSGNGTRVNGDRIKGEVPLRNGDRIEIGNSCLVFTYLGRDRSTSLPAPKAVKQTKSKRSPPAPAEPDPADRPPTQERIVMAAEKLAAELSERFRREDDGLDELPATSMERSMSNPRVGAPSEDAFGGQNSFVEDDDMAAAIQQMAREVSAPNDELSAAVPDDEWADSETATRLPIGAEAAAARGYGTSNAALPPPMPQGASGPYDGASGAIPAVSHSYVVKAADVDRGSPLLMMLVAMVITVIIAAGGVLGYMQFSGQWDVLAALGLSSSPEEEAREQLKQAEAEARAAVINAEQASRRVRDDDPMAWETAALASLAYTRDEKLLEELNAFKKKHGREPVQMPAAFVSSVKPKAVGAGAEDGADRAPSDDGAEGSDRKADPPPASDKKVAKASGDKQADDKAAGGRSADDKAASPARKDDAPKTRTKADDKASGKDSGRVAKAEPKRAPPAKTEPAKTTRTASTRKAPPKKTTSRAKPKPRPKPQPRAKPKPAPSSPKMDDARAAGLWKKAIIALKKDDPARACKFLKIIVSDASKDSVYRTKAKVRMERSCD